MPSSGTPRRARLAESNSIADPTVGWGAACEFSPMGIVADIHLDPVAARFGNIRSASEVMRAIVTELIDHPDPTESGSPAPTGPVSDPRAPTTTERASSGTLAGRVALFVAGIGSGLVAAHAVGLPTPACPLRSMTGFPCPFCGMTHLARDLFGGKFGIVVRNDPAGLVLAVILAVAVAAQIWALARRRRGPVFMTWRTAGLVVLGVLAVHWLTTIFTGGMLTA